MTSEPPLHVLIGTVRACLDWCWLIRKADGAF